MTRGPLRVIVRGLTAGPRQLEADAAHYLARVHRATPGQLFIAVDPDSGTEAHGVVEAVEGQRLTCRLEAPRVATDGGIDSEVELLLPLVKGDKVDRVINAACQIGVDRITVFDCSRAVVHIEVDRTDAKRERWRRILAEATRQCGRAKSPQIAGPVPWSSVLGLATAEGALNLALDPRAALPVSKLLEGACPRVIRVLVGPEGGLSDQEHEACARAGFVAGRLGPHTLRTETAAVVGLGVVVAYLNAAR